MQHSSITYARPIALERSTASAAYGYFALAMALTVAGVFAGMQVLSWILQTGTYLVLTVLELGIVFTAGRWSGSSPLNVVLFAVFPFLSGLTVTPYIVMVLAGYANGGAILLHALSATTFMALAAAVFARTATWDMAPLGRALLLGLIGLIIMGLLQVLFPVLRSTAMELTISGVGILLFAAFTAFDLQRVASMGRAGANPFLLALSLYLDIFNLFLMILRFMVAFSGDRR